MLAKPPVVVSGGNSGGGEQQAGGELATAHELLQVLIDLQRRAEARAEEILREEHLHSGRHARRERSTKLGGEK